jgi:hypothetical protein
MTTDVVDPLVADPAPAPAKGADPAPAKGKAADPAPAPAPSGDDYDWRGAIAGDDKKLGKRLERFTDLNAFGKSYFEADAKLNDGRRLIIPGADATDEDRAAYSKARGIPDDPKKYEIKAKPPEGYEVTEADKTRLEAITARLHKRGGIHADPEVVNAVHELYYAEQEEAAAFAEATAIRQRELTQGQIAKLWPGAEGKRNISFAQAAAEHYFGKAWSEIKDMQFADGSLLGDNFTFLQALAKVGRDHVEDPIFLEAGRNGADAAKTIDTEIQSIMELRSKDRAQYNSRETQSRLAELYTAKARHEERGQPAQ